jgi:hypothetical protein
VEVPARYRDLSSPADDEPAFACDRQARMLIVRRSGFYIPITRREQTLL